MLVQTVDADDASLGLNRFELLIECGSFYFITKPMFKAIDFFFTSSSISASRS
jgi:YidC/Oxa1 family membrane protein insertase